MIVSCDDNSADNSIKWFWPKTRNVVDSSVTSFKPSVGAIVNYHNSKNPEWKLHVEFDLNSTIGITAYYYDTITFAVSGAYHYSNDLS